MLEKQFQAKLVKELKERFSGCVVLKNDAGHVQGIPDLLILYNDKWAGLEVKRSQSSSKRPNQDYYIDKLNKMSFATFIYPENKEEVLDELERTFRA